MNFKRFHSHAFKDCTYLPTKNFIQIIFYKLLGELQPCSPYGGAITISSQTLVNYRFIRKRSGLDKGINVTFYLFIAFAGPSAKCKIFILVMFVIHSMLFLQPLLFHIYRFLSMVLSQIMDGSFTAHPF
jgi:hypothetical protein